jgi:hypothetical protein
MSQTRITVTEEHATTRLTVSPIGLQGVPGEGVPLGATDGQISVYNGLATTWVATTVLSGLTQIAVVDALPDPQVTGTLYFVTP